MKIAPPDAVVACPHAARCPGCDHIGVPYGAQLAAKTALVAAALAPYPTLADLETRSTRGAATIERYRTRSKWVAGRGGALGLFERGGHVVVDLPDCAVAPEASAGATAAVRAVVKSGSVPAVAASLRAIDVREVEDDQGEARCLLTLVLVRERRPSRRELAEAARQIVEIAPRVAGISVNWAPAKAVQILGDETEHLLGAKDLLDRQGEVLVTAAPGSFAQAHRGQAAAMADAIVSGAKELAAPKGELRVLELFSGAAPFGLALARAGFDVTSVESHGPAAGGARRAAAAQSLNLTSLAEDAARAAARFAREKHTFDLVVVDPPRRGLAPSLRAAIADLAPRAVAYVSCDPSTFARDLADFERLGYRARSVEPWDFIPLSAHVESFAWLTRGAAPPLQVLAREGDAAIVASPPHATPASVAAIAARQLGVRAAFVPSIPGASGALIVGVEAVTGSARVVAAVRGRPRPDRRGPWSSLSIRRAHGGRAQVELEVAIADLPKVGKALARAGHPLLGAPEDAPTTRHLAEKYGVDRPLVHVEALEIQQGSTLKPSQAHGIPGDMAAALARLDLATEDRASRT